MIDLTTHFDGRLTALHIDRQECVAAGLSGGPDSMAMLWLLSQWAQPRGIAVYAFTVDHGLRPEAAEEAQQVGVWVSGWPNLHHHILKWQGEKPESRILEEARTARYQLMAQAAQEAGAKFLFIAHHREDQAETILLRMSAGSGLDGLCGMREMMLLPQSEITIVRPLLDVSKEDLLALCDMQSIPFVSDPTNRNEKYARPRLRAVQDALEEEGFSAKRLGALARRMARAKTALDDMAQDLFVKTLKQNTGGNFSFDYNKLRAAPEELVLRVILKVMDEIHPKNDYGPRLERVENLVQRIFKEPDFKGATLGGCIFALKDKNETLWIGRE